MKEKRDQRFGIMLSESERIGLRKLAETEGVSESDVLRQLLRAALYEVEPRPSSAATSIPETTSYKTPLIVHSRKVQFASR